MNILTQEQLKEELLYDPENGNFYWINPKHGRSGDRPAGTTDPQGYRIITLDGQKYVAHRLAFLYMTGNFPTEYVEHQDDNPRNNSWGNLKEMSAQRYAEKKKAKFNSVQDSVHKELHSATPPKREVRARFSDKAVNQAVEDFIKNKTLINGVYV